MHVKVGYIWTYTDMHEIEAFQQLMKLLNWTASYYEMPIFDYGYQQEDGSWTGMIGLLNDGLIDCTANGLRITKERMQVADFSYPMAYFQQTFKIKRPEEEQFFGISEFISQPLTSLHFIIKPFQLEVWFYLFMFCILALVINFLFRSWPDFRGLLDHVHESLWQTMAIVLKQPFLDRGLRATSLFMTSWILFCLIIQIHYQCIISSRLIVPLTPTMPFGSVVEMIDLLDNKSWHLVYPLDIMPTCPVGQCERLRQAVEKTPVKLLDGLEEENEDILRNKGIHVASMDLDFLPQHFMSDISGQFIEIRDDSTGPSWVSFAFRKNFSGIEQFNIALITIFPGLSHMKNRFYPPELKLFPLDHRMAKRVKLGMGQLGETFFLYLSGIAVGMVALAAEVYWNWSRPDRFVKDLRKLSNSRRGIVVLADRQLIRVLNVGRL